VCGIIARSGANQYALYDDLYSIDFSRVSGQPAAAAPGACAAAAPAKAWRQDSWRENPDRKVEADAVFEIPGVPD
jgi:hypothetical protein